MVEYRLVLLGPGGAERHAIELKCRDDDEAIEAAARREHRHAMELWRDETLIWKFEPQNF